MSQNPAYIRFENTYKAMLECVEAIENGEADDASSEEIFFAQKLYALCNKYRTVLGENVDDYDVYDQD